MSALITEAMPPANPDAAAVAAQRVLKTPADLAALIETYVGPEAAGALRRKLAENLEQAIQAVRQVAGQDVQAARDAAARLNANGDELAAELARLSPEVLGGAAREFARRHSALVLELARLRRGGAYAQYADRHDTYHDLLLRLADAVYAAVIHRAAPRQAPLQGGRPLEQAAQNGGHPAAACSAAQPPAPSSVEEPAVGACRGCHGGHHWDLFDDLYWADPYWDWFGYDLYGHHRHHHGYSRYGHRHWF